MHAFIIIDNGIFTAAKQLVYMDNEALPERVGHCSSHPLNIIRMLMSKWPSK
jgi:hypothetical protein